MNLHYLTRCLLMLGACLQAGPLAAQNLAKGKEIHEICAGCHGKHAQGGKNGEYPRLAGQRQLYIEEQLQAFRSRKRLNIPMLPYTQPRELPDEDIIDIAAYLASIPLTTKPPTFSDSTDAINRRVALDRVFKLERADGDIIQGRGIYQAECANCHAKDGKGRSNFPFLVGQYPIYLKRQIDAYRRGDRAHDEDLPAKGVLMPLTDLDIQNILAYLTSIHGEGE
jgi:cytochrome c553